MVIGTPNHTQAGNSKTTPAFTEKHAAKYLNRGFKALMAQDFKDAGACANLVLKYMPKLDQAHFLVGLIALDTSDWTNARKAFLNVVEITDDHAAAWAQLARVHIMSGGYNQAEEALKKAVKFGSDDPLVADVIGTAYTLMGDQTEALTWFDRACEDTDNPMFVMNRAKCLTFLGAFAEAREALERVLALQPQNTQAHWSLSRLEKAPDDKHVQEMQTLLKRFKPNSPPTTYLNYGLGKEYEDLEMWPEAFQAYAQGAKARRAHITYDEAAEIETFTALQGVFTKEWLEAQGEGCLDAAPIFIIGQPRTGTTLVERIITARDDIHSAGELQQFGLAVKRLAGAQGSGMISAETVRAAAEIDPGKLGGIFMESTRSLRSDLPHFVDKLPVNYLYAPLIAAALPNAKIIHVTRDPMDSCFASYKQLFAEAYFHSYDQGEMARHHLRYRRLMDHYRGLLGDRMIEVAYEDVVGDMEGEARRLVTYLGLDWQAASLDFHTQKSAVTTASATQVREKAHSRSVGRWRQFETELTEMHEILIEN
ncbi:MAG: sulfotransferase [Alphaproteobacteria bacterium]|nr:MAG: sulfotransferase [Alphaproteobacteria bacterium]